MLGLIGGCLACAAPAAGTVAGDVCPADADPCVVASLIAVRDGSILDFGTRTLVIESGGRLDVGRGTMTILAHRVEVRPRGELRARGGARSVGGTVQLNAQVVNVDGGIDASGQSGGRIDLGASMSLRISGTLSADATTLDGTGGTIDLSCAELTAGGVILAAGGANGFGGTVRVSSGAGASVDARIDVSGNQAGDIVIGAGEAGGGDLVIGGAARLFANGSGAGGAAGTISLSASGDGVQSGDVVMNGVLRAAGTSGGELGGGDGGTISIDADGMLLGDDPGGSYEANGGAPDGFGGEITLSAGAGIDLASRLTARGQGSEGSGGDITLRAGGDLVVRGTNSVSGADSGGSIALRADGTLLEIGDSAVIDAGGVFGGPGGSIAIVAGRTRVAVNGAVLANGGASGSTTEAGLGGDVEIESEGDVVVNGRMQVLGGSGGGDGGTLTISSTASDVHLNGSLAARGQGRESLGGEIFVNAGRCVQASGNLDVRGSRSGGFITILAMSDIGLLGELNAGGRLGAVEVAGGAFVAVSGLVSAVAEAGMDGGRVDISGCEVRVEEDGALLAGGNGSSNRVSARETLTVAGRMQAAASGGNELIVRRSEAVRIVAGAQIEPPPLLRIDETLLPCPRCGNGVVELPETCDDGGSCSGGANAGLSCTDDEQCLPAPCVPLGGDGCSAMCQIEAVLGDVNGDQRVDSADLADLAREIFDGDGDRTLAVASGSFPGTPGADANLDDRITAADLAAIASLLVD